MRGFLAALVLGVALILPGVASAERVVARVSITDQTMKVYHEGRLLYTWPVSTAKAGKITPPGPMNPSSCRATTARALQQRADALCDLLRRQLRHPRHRPDQASGQTRQPRLRAADPENAEILFEMVKAEGMENTRVVIVQ
jgi:hypothetical protein